MAKGTQNKDAAQAAASLPQDPAAAPVTGETPAVVAPVDETPAPAAEVNAPAAGVNAPADQAPSPDPATLQADAEAKAHADAEAKRIAEEAAGNQDDEEEEDFQGNVKNFVESLTDYQADILFAELSARRGSKGTGKAKKGFKVVSPFRDSDNFSKEYQVGEDVSHLPKERLKKLVDLSLVEQK